MNGYQVIDSLVRKHKWNHRKSKKERESIGESTFIHTLGINGFKVVRVIKLVGTKNQGLSVSVTGIYPIPDGYRTKDKLILGKVNQF